MHVSAGALRRGSSLETEVAMSHLSCVLGTELPLEEQYALLTSEPLPSSILVLNTQPVHFVPCMPSCVCHHAMQCYLKHLSSDMAITLYEL